MLHLDQKAYLEKVLQEAQIINKNSKSTKMPMNDESCIRPINPKNKQTDRKPYQKKVGLVMYAAINMRPDIAFAVEKLSQYMVDPARHHEQAMKYLMRYL